MEAVVHETGPEGRQTALQYGTPGKAEALLKILESNPFATPPTYEKLKGDLSGLYSRRINLQHRLVYTVNESEQVVKVLRMWTHYE